MLDAHIYVKIIYTYVPMCMQACSGASQEVLRTCGHLWDRDQETTMGHYIFWVCPLDYLNF